MGDVARFFVGGILMIGGAVIGLLTGNWTVAALLASTGLGLVARPSLSLADQQGHILDLKIGTQQSVPKVYGTTRVGAILADIREDPASTNNKRLVIVAVWCTNSLGGDIFHGTGIYGITNVYFDDVLVIDGQNVQAPYSGQGEDGVPYLTFRHHLGEQTTVDAGLTAMFPTEWPATSKGQGLAYSVFELWFDSNIWPGGMPTRIQATLQGVQVYDPRDATWKYSVNPALCVRDFLRDPINGYDIPAGNLTEQTFIDIANYCEELVAIPGLGNSYRYTLEGAVDTDRGVAENLANLATACRGMVINQSDQWRLFVRRARTGSSLVLDETNTVGGSWKFSLPGGGDAPNVVRANYVDPGQGYQADSVQWPPAGEDNPYLDEDNGFEFRTDVDLPFTALRARAQQMAMTLLKEARQGIACQCVLQERMAQIQVGDLVKVTRGTPGWTDKWFDVLALLLRPDGQIGAVLAEYDSSGYDLDTQPTPPTFPDTNLPNPFTCAPPTNVVLTCDETTSARAPDGSRVNQILVEWTASVDPFVNHYLVYAGREGETPILRAVAVAGDISCYIGPVGADELWFVQMVAVNGLGVTSVLTAAEWVHAIPLPSQEHQNMVVNGDGQASPAGEVAEGWTNQSGHSLYVTDETAYSGDRCLKLVGTGGSTPDFNYESYAVEVGEVYHVTAKMKTDGALGGAGVGAYLGLWMDALDGLFDVLDAHGAGYLMTQPAVCFMGIGPAGNTSWREVYGAVRITNAGTMRLYCNMGGGTSGNTGTAFFDEVRLERVASEVYPSQPVPKTWRIGAGALTPVANTPGWQQNAEGSVQQAATGASLVLTGSIPLPKGVTITKARFHGYRENANGNVICQFLQCVPPSNPTEVCWLQLDSTGWLTDESGTLSKLVGNEHYLIRVTLNGDTNPAYAKFSYFEVDYTMPTYAATV